MRLFCPVNKARLVCFPISVILGSRTPRRAFFMPRLDSLRPQNTMQYEFEIFWIIFFVEVCGRFFARFVFGEGENGAVIDEFFSKLRFAGWFGHPEYG